MVRSTDENKAPASVIENSMVFCTNDRYAWRAIGEIQLHLDDLAFQTNHSAGIDAGKHMFSLEFIEPVVNAKPVDLCEPLLFAYA